MAALDPPAYRKSDLLRPLPPPSAPGRRATVGSPPPSILSNSIETFHPPSRNGSDFPYRRRSTVSGHSQGHNVNDAPPLTVYGDAYLNTMWSESASPSPVMHTAFLRGSSPAPSSSCASPKPMHTTFDYEHSAFSHVIHPTSFVLCPSPDFPPHLGQPRMPPPLPATFSAATSSTIRPSTAGTTTTPALSPTASSTSFIVEPPIAPSNRSSPGHPDASLSSEEFGSEVDSLRQRVRQLEWINYFVRLRVAELESDDKTGAQSGGGLGLQFTADPSNASYTSSSSNSADTSQALSFLSHELGPPPSDWPARTAARLKRFCAVNRAGNALCAWHDSRRERRAYPPRMAPPNTLNCGCTYDEALFEESLARNGVGHFLPGDHVRMDPALRNPLLKLLEERYGYKDGDFERTPGGWQEGQDAQSWDERAAGARNTRRDR